MGKGSVVVALRLHMQVTLRHGYWWVYFSVHYLSLLVCIKGHGVDGVNDRCMTGNAQFQFVKVLDNIAHHMKLMSDTADDRDDTQLIHIPLSSTSTDMTWRMQVYSQYSNW
jgi:hypothetical protein